MVGLIYELWTMADLLIPLMHSKQTIIHNQNQSMNCHQNDRKTSGHRDTYVFPSSAKLPAHRPCMAPVRIRCTIPHENELVDQCIPTVDELPMKSDCPWPCYQRDPCWEYRYIFPTSFNSTPQFLQWHRYGKTWKIHAHSPRRGH